MRTPIVAGNWKMNTTLSEALTLVDAMLPELDALSTVERVVCPPFISLVSVAERLRGTSVLVGAQNCHTEPKGAFTGEISPTMLAGLVTYVILGHSERRQYFGEADDLVGQKARAALDHGLKAIVCVGERLDENEAGSTREVVERQLRGALGRLSDADLEHIVVAYEPVWAIGTGRAATPEIANDVISFIRSTLGALVNGNSAELVRVQYGGSVTPDNFLDFIAQSEIDGALVGGASLNAASFVQIVRQAAEAKGST